MAWPKAKSVVRGSGLNSQPINQPGVSKNPLNPGDLPQGPYAPNNFTFPDVHANPQNPAMTGTGTGVSDLPARKPLPKFGKKYANGKKSGLFGDL